MTKLSKHQSNEYTKMMVLGNPGTGKTGGLTSLVKAGYWLGILDMDNGLDSLKQYIRRECPDMIDNVEYRTLRDEARMTEHGRTVIGAAKAYTTAVDMCDNWKYGDVDEGPPWKWGPGRILVIDSLTFLCQAAFDWCEQMVQGKGGKYDQRMVFYAAQKSIMNLMSTITSERFKTNVIVLTHIRYQEGETGITKGFPNTIGQAISTMIGAYFNTLVMCEARAGGARKLVTLSTSQIDLKNPAPFIVEKEYPLSTGYASLFKALRTEKETTPPPKTDVKPYVKPKQLQLRRV